ncbi:MAG: AMP-binding protein, partial [Flavobacteriales bacterium]|nr:AMP-binding protein [Flavobacteriales bacterium]
MKGLGSYFDESCVRHGARTALVIDGRSYTYAELDRAADVIADRLHREIEGGEIVAFTCRKQFSTYASLLGILRAGKAYLPVRHEDPRTAMILEQAGVQVLLGGEEEAKPLVTGDITWIDTAIDGSDDSKAPIEGTELQRSELAYLLFTSGSTGIPKGVPIGHAQATAYVDHVLKLLDPSPSDRASQFFDLTFDLSVHDLFVTWAAGAALCVPAPKDLLKPAQFLRNERISMHFSVPSLAVLMERSGQLRPDTFPDLRTSAFCGEALPITLADNWRLAAPNARIWNLYGPTETTIAIMSMELGGPIPGHAGIVSIGTPFPGHAASVVDDVGLPADEGELIASGPQVA